MRDVDSGWVPQPFGPPAFVRLARESDHSHYSCRDGHNSEHCDAEDNTGLNRYSRRINSRFGKSSRCIKRGMEA